MATAFPLPPDLPPDLIRRAQAAGLPFAAPAGARVFRAGDRCESLPLLRRGVVRVFLHGPDGREITLYRVRRGEGCVLTASCLLSQRAYPVDAVVEADAEGVMLPAAVARGWMDSEPAWRTFVLGLIAGRLGEVLGRLEQSAFAGLDTRLARALVARGATRRGARVELTHQRLADEIASAREAVSRRLADWRERGWIDAGRGWITVRKPTPLRKLAEAGDAPD
jgi:CRP/FNR family transcriptional regulator